MLRPPSFHGDNMARPKKLSGNDKFMLGKLRGKGLYLKPKDSGIPITTHWYEWRGIILSGQYCNIDKKYRIPDKDKKPTDKKLGRRKTKGIRLGSLGFGNTPQENRRIIKKNNHNAGKFILYTAICKRLLEYKEKGILSKMLIGIESERTYYRILKDYSSIAKTARINEKYETILSDLGLPKK